MNTKASQLVYFSKVELIDPKNPQRLDFVRARRSPALPEQIRTLIRSIQETEHVIGTVFLHSPNLRKKFFEDLHMAADMGLRGERFDVALGFDNLAEIKSDIADQFPAVRSYYWLRYGNMVLWCLVFLLLGGVAYYAAKKGLWGVSQADANGFPLMVALMIAALLIPVGVAIGLFLEYAFRVDTVITYERLQTINPARWDPLQRIVNTTISAYVLAAIMGFGIFQIGVSNVLLNDFMTTKPYLSLVVGFVAGFATPYVQDVIRQIRPTTRGGQPRTRIQRSVRPTDSGPNKIHQRAHRSGRPHVKRRTHR